MSGYRFQVITGVPDMNDDHEAIGNLAACFELWQADQGGISVTRISPMTTIGLRAPVFHVGEILVVSHDGREVAGLGRKASKWSVAYDEFATIDEAVERALVVTP